MNSTPKHSRRSIRLPEYDYSRTGYYYVTLCTHEMTDLFGDIEEGNVILNEYGKVVEEELLKSKKIRRELTIDYSVIMPNHIHVITIIDVQNDATIRANGRSPLRIPGKRISLQMKPKSLSSFIAGYKSVCTKRINQIRKTPGNPVWQRNYYERIIRNNKELQEIRNYIRSNPMRWDIDRENLSNVGANGRSPLPGNKQ